jgi:hypothetical protein
MPSSSIRRARVLGAASVFALVCQQACGSSSSGGPSEGSDAGEDATTDGSASTDATSGADARAAVDSSTDAASAADAEASADSSTDGGSDGGDAGCPTGQVMEAGACVLSCDAGATACGGSCVDTTSDPANCGGCGTPCAAPNVCSASTCAPPACTGPLSLATAVPYAASASPDGFVIADVNGDARPDLVVPTSTYSLSGGTAEILVLINNGDGSFSAGVPYTVAHDPVVAVGDVDGDAKPDIVVTEASAGTATVLLNGGTGTFTAQTPLAIAGAPTGISLGDVNGDGKADVYWVVGATFNAAYGDGHGSFATTPVSTTFTGATTVINADLNGDTTVDAVFAFGTPTVDVTINTGTGTLFPSTSYIAMAAVTGLSFADWNRDGKLDILAAGSPYTVLLNGGAGTFQTQLALASPPAFTAAADVNGDGKLDLVGLAASGSSEAIDVWLNDGNDTFTTLVAAGVAQYGVEVGVGDLNGDGFLDLVALSQPASHTGTLSVVLNTCPH